jgi:hypothetical protein
MKEILQKRFSVLIISGLLVSLGLLFVGYSWTLGFLLGFAFSFLTVNITKYQVDSVLIKRKQSWTTYVKFILGNLIYIVPFVISILLYDWFNLFAVGIGLLYFKYFIFISEIFFRQKENK